MAYKKWRIHDPYHQQRKGKIKKRCLRCKKQYKDITSLSIEPVDPQKPQPGICCECASDEDEVYGEEDFHQQSLLYWNA